jgi:prephenate dehydrogenase
LAGSEKQGCASARSDLFDGHLTVITPTERTPADAIAQVRRFWESLGCGIRLMTAEEHDKAVALTSHLPHLLSATLAGMLPANLSELTATGFRDMTRLAGGDASLWTAILIQNRVNLSDAIGTLQNRLAKFQSALTANDANAIERFLTDAKRIRDDLGD